ncbi:hypothetical protein OKW41_005089 [Paraburkholderia sp. UCT70]|uniref:hypothetical protein n=1 Tax=Paraburkholderia sp. UCT70 TaxID=2991068 RepID=UPI003D19DCF9
MVFFAASAFLAIRTNLAARGIDPKADHLPRPTGDALKRRMGKAIIYVIGGRQQAPEALVRQLNHGMGSAKRSGRKPRYWL